MLAIETDLVKFVTALNSIRSKPRKYKRLIRQIGVAAVVSFLLLNLIAMRHAWQFTHFSNDLPEQKTAEPGQLSFAAKLKVLCLGISNPRPVDDVQPAVPFDRIVIQANKKMECWHIKTDSAIGTVVLCHGYGGTKSSMLDKAMAFRKLGYNALLVGFMGSGGSEGNQTTIGHAEAFQVKAAVDYLQQTGETNVILCGTSMGAVAIMKAVSEFRIQTSGLILECPFGSLYQTVVARFRMMHAPVFPMAGIMVFWGGIENGFNAFGHNPVEYAKGIRCPVLLCYGEKDSKVSRSETDAILNNLKGRKQLITFPQAGHENFLIRYEAEWTKAVAEFAAGLK